MASHKLKEIRFSIERSAKNSRRIDIYLIVLAFAFILTFLMTQILLGIYYV